MRDKSVRLRLPDGFDALLRDHVGEPRLEVTDAMRREYLVALLAAVFDGLASPTVADGLIRLNGVRAVVPRGARVH